MTSTPDASSQPPGPIAGVAQDATTLIDVLAELSARGYTNSFNAVDTAAVECAACHTPAAAADVEILEFRRLEGASDPADMLAVVALDCPHCHTPGTLILGFGPDASSQDTDILQALPDQTHTDDAP